MSLVTGGVRVLSGVDVQATAVAALGLDPESVDLQSPEALAGLIRRAASFKSPCSPRLLREAVVRSVRGLDEPAGDRSRLRDSLDEAIEALTVYGDLIELPTEDEGEGSVRTLYLAPPTFVCVGEVLFLLGGLLDGGDALPSDLRPLVEFRSHTRRLSVADPTEVAKRLRAIGWVDLRREFWLPPPRRETALQLVERLDTMLLGSESRGEVPGLTILDPEMPVAFYSGRWRLPDRKSGRFVARREQRYGANLWSFVELDGGIVTRLIDFPSDANAGIRPCDAAWHSQMAIDAISGRPQVYRLRSTPPAGSVLVDFFSPVPLWARRGWDVLGEVIPPQNCLFSYRFPSSVFGDVEVTLSDALWMKNRAEAKLDSRE